MKSIKCVILSAFSTLLYMTPLFIAVSYFLLLKTGQIKTIDLNVCFVLAVIAIILHFIGKIIKGYAQQARMELVAQNRSKQKFVYTKMTAQERKKANLEQKLKDERILSSIDYKNTICKGSKNPDRALNKMTGLEQVKKSVIKYKVQIQNKNHDGSMHMCFLGNPGTGKTTIASIITGYLFQLKYIKKNEYISVDGNFFKSSSDPLERTRMLLSRAKGKVLFIDEAYSIIQGNSGIGLEILATILNEMENNRNDMIVILAGYKKEMKDLFNANSGLSSRIKNYFIFEDYSITELKEMFQNLIHEKNLVIPAYTMDVVESVIYKKKTQKNFANGRTVRNLAEQCYTEHLYNLNIGIISKDDKYILMPEDIVKSSPEDHYFD